jgi:hypothetical protein
MIPQWILLHLLLINLNRTTVITSCHLLLLENGNNTNKGKANYEHQIGETRQRQGTGSKEGDGLSDSLTTGSRGRLARAHGEPATAEEESSAAAARPGGCGQLRA